MLSLSSPAAIAVAPYSPREAFLPAHFRSSLRFKHLPFNRDMEVEFQEEYIRNSRGVQLFTCRWLPFSSPKALVFLCHGYGMECSNSMKGTNGRGGNGYGHLLKGGYGMATAALSEAMFLLGAVCDACFELRCVDDLRWCLPDTSIIVTATNFYAPNYGFSSEAGGCCNPPNQHFVLPIGAFEKIAIWKAGNMPALYRSGEDGGGP